MAARKSVGELVQHFRIKKGLSIGQLAELVGVNKANISRLERGATAQPATLARLAEVLDVDLDRLFTAAGIESERDLPSFMPYLRTRYGHLPPDKLDELQAQFDQIVADYEAAPKTTKRPKGGRHVTNH